MCRKKGPDKLQINCDLYHTLFLSKEEKKLEKKKKLEKSGLTVKKGV